MEHGGGLFQRKLQVICCDYVLREQNILYQNNAHSDTPVNRKELDNLLQNIPIL